MIWSIHPSKLFKKIPSPKKKKIHDKAVQSNILWLNLNKISEISTSQSAIKKVTPRFTFMRWDQNADTHALKPHRLSQNNSPACSNFVLVIASDMQFESESGKR